MSGTLFIPPAALAPAGGCGSIVPGPAAPETAIVRSHGWWPDIDLAMLRKATRIRDTVTTERLRDAVLGAIITLGLDLDAWGERQRAAGAASLATVPGRANVAIDGEPRLVILYRRAIGATAKAELVERYRDLDSTKAGDREADALDQTPSELRRDAVYAIRDILGRGRIVVDLI